jgi:hypothetical protein
MEDIARDMGAFMKALLDALIQRSGPALLALIFILLLLIRPLIVLFDALMQGGADNEQLMVKLPLFIVVASIFVIFSIFAIRNIPILQKSDADYALKLRGVFGGVTTDSSGSPVPLGLSENRAITLTNKILQAIGQRAVNLGFENVRANIFHLEVTTTSDNRWCAELTPDLRFSYNMEWGIHSNEDQIRIPFGVGSSGMSFKYARPVFCFKKADGSWQHMDEGKPADEYLKTQLSKVHTDLKWILSMPVPSRLSPRYILKGIINVDCIGRPWDEKKAELLKELAIDVSVAAALVGLLNKSSGHLHGLENELMDKSDLDDEVLKAGDQEVLSRIELDPNDFDPRDCPAPSVDFVNLLAGKAGLGGLTKLAPQDISDYLKRQLSL